MLPLTWKSDLFVNYRGELHPLPGHLTAEQRERALRAQKLAMWNPSRGASAEHPLIVSLRVRLAVAAEPFTVDGVGSFRLVWVALAAPDRHPAFSSGQLLDVQPCACTELVRALVR
ncbi:hypothetical protein [Streptomyces sp. NPDC004324]